MATDSTTRSRDCCNALLINRSCSAVNPAACKRWQNAASASDCIRYASGFGKTSFFPLFSGDVRVPLALFIPLLLQRRAAKLLEFAAVFVRCCWSFTGGVPKTANFQERGAQVNPAIAQLTPAASCLYCVVDRTGFRTAGRSLGPSVSDVLSYDSQAAETASGVTT